MLRLPRPRGGPPLRFAPGCLFGAGACFGCLGLAAGGLFGLGAGACFGFLGLAAGGLFGLGAGLCFGCLGLAAGGLFGLGAGACFGCLGLAAGGLFGLGAGLCFGCLGLAAGGLFGLGAGLCFGCLGLAAGRLFRFAAGRAFGFLCLAACRFLGFGAGACLGLLGLATGRFRRPRAGALRSIGLGGPTRGLLRLSSLCFLGVAACRLRGLDARTLGRRSGLGLTECSRLGLLPGKLGGIGLRDDGEHRQGLDSELVVELAQLAPPDLPARGLRELIQERHRAWVLVRAP